MNLAEHYLDGAVGDIVEELAVVRNQDYGTSAILQIIFQPFNGFNVKVVGGLIQKHHIRLAQQNLRKFNPHIPALTESLGRPAQFFIFESQTQQCLFRLDLGSIIAKDGEPVVQFIQMDDKFTVRL